LLAEEAQQWRQELHWDYRASIDLIKKFVDARSLTGSAVIENGEPVGMRSTCWKNTRGWSATFRLPALRSTGMSQQLLAAHSQPWAAYQAGPSRGATHSVRLYLDPILSSTDFGYSRAQFMLVPLAQTNAGTGRHSRAHSRGPGRGANPRTMGPPLLQFLRALIQLAYANHVDGEIMTSTAANPALCDF